MNHAGILAAFDPEADRGEDLYHLAVLLQHVGPELGDALTARDPGQVLEEQGADPPALEFIGHCECDLRPAQVILLLQSRVSADADDVLVFSLTKSGDQGHLSGEIDVRELRQLALAQPLFETKKAEVNRSRTQSGEESQQMVLVVVAQGTNINRSAVAQDCFRLILSKIHMHLNVSSKKFSAGHQRHGATILIKPEVWHIFLSEFSCRRG